MSSRDERPARRPPPPAAVATDVLDHGRRYAIYTGNTLLGTSNLEYPVSRGQRVAGRFLPTPAWDRVTAVFLLYAEFMAAGDREVLREYVTQRDRLRLELWDAGVRVNAVVELISTWPDGTHIVHVTSSDERLWRPRLYPD